MISDWVGLLWTDGPPMAPTSVFHRKVRVRDVQRTGDGQPLTLTVEWASGDKSNLPREGETGHWLWLEAAFTSTDVSAQRFGRIDIPFSSYPNIRPPFERSMGTVERWGWAVTVHDAEQVDAYRRRTNPNGPILFNLTVKGFVQLGVGTYPVLGQTQVSVEVSQWERYLGWVGYAIPPTVTELVSGMVTDAAGWKKAGERLATARRLLRAGDTRPALEAVFNELEAVCGTPHIDAAWNDLLGKAGVDKQKAAALAGWLGGFGRYINSVGHHRQPQPNPDEPVADQWEAESLMASAQLLLTVAFRSGLDLRQPAAQRAVPVSSATT